MDLALLAMKKLRAEGKLEDLEVSDEINACSIVVPVEIDGVVDHGKVQRFVQFLQILLPQPAKSLKDLYILRRLKNSPQGIRLFNPRLPGIHRVDAKIRVLIRYDIENLSGDTYDRALGTIFSEPPVDFLYEEDFPRDETDLEIRNMGRGLYTISSRKTYPVTVVQKQSLQMLSVI